MKSVIDIFELGVGGGGGRGLLTGPRASVLQKKKID